jgi:hypothetical protein
VHRGVGRPPAGWPEQDGVRRNIPWADLTDIGSCSSASYQDSFAELGSGTLAEPQLYLQAKGLPMEARGGDLGKAPLPGRAEGFSKSG